MKNLSAYLALADVVSGQAIFEDNMPVWFGRFGDNTWPFVDSKSPLYLGETTSSITWNDYILGRGATFNNYNSYHKSIYKLCLTPEIVVDLKIAAVIHGFFPRLIKDARNSKGEIDPKTVKGRIDELAKFFSLVIEDGRKRYGYIISRLSDIPLHLVKENIPKFSGRSSHLKRALKLISDPIVQKNLSAPLKWTLLDITKSSIAWSPVTDGTGILPLSDVQFLFLLRHCKQSVAAFKCIAKIEIHDGECKALPSPKDETDLETFHIALEAYYGDRLACKNAGGFKEKYGVHAREVSSLIRDAHASALMLILLFTGMRSTETKFVMRDSLAWRQGYWFIDSKVVKGQPKDKPICEGWLAIDLVKDAYDVLMYITERTGNLYLFSSAVVGFADKDTGYHGGALNDRFSKWIRTIDKEHLFSSWKFSIHQCRETLVFQLAQQNIGMPFLSMQLKHFHSQFNTMPNAVTAGYGKYRSQLMNSVSTRIAQAREGSLMSVYSEDAKFAGGGGPAHKARIDAFFTGLGLFGAGREQYIKAMARRGVKLMPTSIGNCTKNFLTATDANIPPCYGDYQCDPECQNHVITERGARALVARKEHALTEAAKEPGPEFKVICLGLAKALDGHIGKPGSEG